MNIFKLIKYFIQKYGRSPSPSELYKLQQKAKNISKQNKVIQFPPGGKDKINPFEPRPEGIKSLDEFKASEDVYEQSMKPKGARPGNINYEAMQEKFPDVKLHGDESFQELLDIEKTGKHPRDKADGGRIGFFAGGAKGLLKLLQGKLGKKAITTADDMKLSDSVLTRKMFADFNKRNKKATADELVDPNVTLEKALDEVGGNFASGDMKYNADILADELAFQRGLIKEGEDITYIADQATRSKLYNEAYSALSAQFLKLRNMKKQAAIDISDPRVAEDFTNFIKKNDPKSYKELEQKVDLMNFDPTGRKKNAKGGLAKILEV